VIIVLKYSISNWIYGDEPFEKTLERLTKFRYDGVEIKGEPRTCNVKKVKELLRSYNLEASSIAGMYPWPTSDRDLANADEKVRKRAVNYVKECLDFARDVEAPLAIVVPSPVMKTKPSEPLDKEWKWAVESVRMAGRYAMDVNVLIAVEPINRYETYLVNNVDQALKFIAEVGIDSVKVMLDCFHMNIEEPDPAAAIRKAGKNLVHIHVADSNRQSVGRGHTDFKSIIRSLKEIGYTRYLAMEPLPPLADPYMAIKGVRPEEFSDLYAEECIQQLKFFERAP
jgi:sugar phosphate isomerase/epimerase